MSEVGAFEAKTQFSRLLARAAGGEEITITHRGRPVARLVPAEPAPGSARARAALARLRERAEAAKLAPFDWSEWKHYRDEGRR